MLVGVRRGCTFIIAAFSPTLFAQTSNETGAAPAPIPPCETVCWLAPPTCPNEADVQARIAEHQLLGPDGAKTTALPVLGLSAQVTQRASVFELVLTRQGQTRVIRSADCNVLADATAMVVVLSQRNNASWTDVLATPLPDTVPATSEPPPPPEPPAVQSAEPEQQPPPPEPEPPQPFEDPAMFEQEGEGTTPECPWISGPRVAVGGILDAWLLPSVGPGLRVRGGARIGTWLEASLVGNWIPLVSAPIEGSDFEAEYAVWSVGAQLCGAAPELEWLAVCAAFELASITGFAPGLQDPRRRNVLSPNPGLGAHWLPNLGSFFLDVGLEGWFPLRNDVFTVNAEGQALHKIPSVTARASLLVGYKF